jgi:hypothetical protein
MSVLTKVCRKCKENLPLDCFTKHHSTKDRLRHECRNCRTIESRELNHRNPEKRNNRNRKRYKINKLKIREYKKNHPCVDCGNSDFRVLTFHHLYNKKYVIARMAMYSWKRTMKEIKKCIVLCANCHLIRHFQESE